MALPLPDIDTTQDNAWKWRGHLQVATDSAYAEYGEDAGWPGIPPFEIFEAIMSHESDGIPDAINPNLQEGSQPIGLMQILPTGDIAGYYSTLTGDKVDATKLRDPETNIKTGVIGFTEKIKDKQVWAYPNTGWPRLARMAWYGAGRFTTRQDGSSVYEPTATVQGANGVDYGGDGDAWEADVTNYVSGFNTKDDILAGNWRKPDDPKREQFVPYWNDPTHGPIYDFIDGAYDGVTATIDKGKKALTSIDDLVSFVTNVGNWVRLGVIILAVAFVGLGTTGLLF